MSPKDRSVRPYAWDRRRDQDLDSLVHTLLTHADLRSCHAMVTLIGAGTDIKHVAEALQQRTDGKGLRPGLRSAALRRPLEEATQWLPVTGGVRVSTLHVLLLALATRDSVAGTLLRERGLTVPLCLTAAALTQEQADAEDRAFGARADEGRAGPTVPDPPPREAMTLGSRRVTRLMNRMYGGPGYLRSETELDRMPTASRIVLVNQLLGWTVLLLSLDTILRQGTYWALTCLLFLSSGPGQVPPSLIVASSGVMAFLGPWWLTLLLALRLPFAWIDAWYDVERKRAETSRPDFSLRDLRRETRAATTEVIAGGHPQEEQ